MSELANQLEQFKENKNWCGHALSQSIAEELTSLRGKLKACEQAFLPVRHWYDEDGQVNDLAKMISEAVSDLQDDRQECIDLKNRIARKALEGRR